MLAAWFERLGPARETLHVGEMADPIPGPGEVRVRLHASGVNPSDVKRRMGATGAPPPYPRTVPHSDGAGVIDKVGAGVPSSRVGERVWVYNGQWERAHGTAAESIALRSEQAVRLPEGTSFVEGACLGIPAMTAHRCVFADGPVQGQTLLVTGGAGAVGGYAIQLARWGGATVIATVSSEEKARVAKDFGAHHVINYKTGNVAQQVKELTGGQGVHRIVDVDFGGNLETSFAVLRENGTLAMYATAGNLTPVVPARTQMLRNITVRGVLVYTMEDSAKAQACQDITRWLESGSARHLIAARFPLREIVAAHELQESGKYIGNIVIDTHP
jgi:NADPH2:quinone reductase